MQTATVKNRKKENWGKLTVIIIFTTCAAATTTVGLRSLVSVA